MLNIRFTLDIGKNEPQEKVKNPCHKSDGDYSEQFRYLIRKQISEAIEKRTNSTLIGNVLEKRKLNGQGAQLTSLGLTRIWFISKLTLYILWFA